MKISSKMKAALDNQVALESNASNTYLAMASWCESIGYEGASSYFYGQSSEERDHMLKLIHYINDLGVGATIPSVNAPEKSYKSLESIIKAALKNEQDVTKAIHKMVEIAQKDKDHSTGVFLEWFVNEQAHEEAKFEAILQKFDLIGRDKLAVNEIDKSLAAQATAPAEQL